VADPLETRIPYIRVNTPNFLALGRNRFGVDRESQKIRGRLGPAPWELGGADPKKHVPASCYGTKFGRSRSYYMGVRRGGPTNLRQADRIGKTISRCGIGMLTRDKNSGEQ